MRGIVVLVAVGALLAGCTSTEGGTGSAVRSSSSRAPASTSSTPSTPSTPRPSRALRTSRTPRTPRTSRATTARPTIAPPALPRVSFPPGSGPVIALNPGHNGGNGAHPAEINRLVPADRHGGRKACDTTGTNTDAGYPEHAFNWDVTLRVRALLQGHGVRVILTRPDDAGVGPCVDARAAIGNEPGVAAVISIHADGAGAGGHGFHVCEDSQPPAGPATATRSHQLTVAVHDALLRGSGLTTSTYLGANGYFPRADLAGLNLATVPATFLELGNMRNPGDAALQSSAAGRQRIAAAVAAGILAYLGGR
jgi:N-acetylmuramoyl-L-alanine amidase